MKLSSIRCILILCVVGAAAWSSRVVAAEPTPARDAAEMAAGFETPPPGFGEIPFWWWTGEKLDVERLNWQIDELVKKGISGAQVNYAHQDVRNNVQPNWLTYPNDPEVFTDEWFDVFAQVAAKCREKGFGIGLSGYTLDWQNSPNNLYDKLIYRETALQSRTLFVAARERARLTPDFNAAAFASAVADAMKTSDAEALTKIVAYPLAADGKIDAARFAAVEPERLVQALAELAKSNFGDAEIWVYKTRRSAQTLNPLHPDAGKTVVERFFNPFAIRAKALIEQSGGTADENSDLGLNYFFQDELQIGTGDMTWCDDFPEEFEARKGYSVWTAAPAMFGAGDANLIEKRRLDYMATRVRLAEERYFIPIFNWHADKGRIYACDSGGRGKDPREFGDYFSAARWYTAPGHDTPGGNADFIKNKVSSSVAHFYGRPRVWLEGYHSFGWGASPERLLFATNENYLFGANLLNLHGLYYTTYGGFWEWAPPCYHFRQPYWDAFGAFLKYFERLSYVLTRGVERADVVVLYPVSPYQANLGGDRAREIAFAAADKIYNSGRDVLFIDDESVKNAEIADGKMRVAGGEHSIFVLPSIRAARWTTLQKALELYRAGGTVIALDALPETSDAAGRGDAALDAAVREIFGLTAADAAAGKVAPPQRSDAGGRGAFFSPKAVAAADAPSAEGDLLSPAGEVSKIRDYSGGFAGRWAWSAELRKNVYFKWIASGLGDEPTPARAKFFCDNAGALYVNGARVAEGV
ncbi:MAG: hypothetical protein HUK22_05725, partial [Thermoguttaceae bacterium]|nr:hypothetical protein [Thermoguttaceae bacterium]